MTQIQVTKREGHREGLDLEKLHRAVFWATEGITGVSASEIEIKSHIQFYNGIKTSDIQETLIKSAADLISEETPNYQYVAGRLICYHLRKQVYNSYTPWPLLSLVKRNVGSGFYDAGLLTAYTEAEWMELDSYIRHERDENFTYVAMEQWRGKYLVQNRVTGEIFETPQVAYMLIAATLFQSYPVQGEKTRMQWVRDYYECVSNGDISLPTPVMAGVRTPQKQFSSCVLIETGDSLDSINATASAIVRYVSQKAGIGIGAGRIRALGSPIRNGDAYHTGMIPFLKYFQSATRSCSQGGVRNGAATVYYPVWHYELEDLLVLKNNKGTEDNRVRQMDYGLQFNLLMYERLIAGGDITLFSPHDVPEMYEAFFNNQERFRELYERAERNTKLRKKTVKAIDVFSRYIDERKDTGRIYLQNSDHANTHSPFREEVAPVRMSNLCGEIDLPTVPLNDINDGATLRRVRVPKDKYEEFLKYKEKNNGYLFRDWLYELVPNDAMEDTENYIYLYEHVRDDDGSAIALCTLSAINWGNIKSPADFEKPCTLAVRGLDALLSYQNYPVRALSLIHI